IHLYAKNLDQDKYINLIDKMNGISEHVGYPVLIASNDEIIPVDQLDNDMQRVVIFDDYVCEKVQKPLIDYFIQGRHKNCSVIYLTQSFYGCPKAIRFNCSHFCLYDFPSSRERNLISQELGINKEIDGIGFKLTDDGNYDIDGKRLTNVADSIDDSDAVSLKVLKEHTQVSQNNYHLQSSFKIYKEFGDKSQLTVGSPPNTSPNHFFQNHKAHNDAYIIEKEGYDTGFYGEAWSSIKMKVHGDSHYTIITFDSDKINSQYTKSIIQFTTDGRAGVNDGIKLQLKYFGSQYNKNIRFLFYSRVVKGKQSTSFNHIIFNVSDVVDNHTILYFENLNLNGNLIDGLGDPVYLDSATNKKYVDVAIADKESKSNVQNYINNLNLLIRHNLPMDGRRSMTGNLNMGGNEIVNIKPFVEDDDIQPQQDNHAITFGYFHTERGELKRLINEVGYNALNRKNPDQMEDDIDMEDNRILNLNEP
ncbi:unnamed protein product, partial [Pocillopora meandrina]